jgi:hypothetical protein
MNNSLNELKKYCAGQLLSYVSMTDTHKEKKLFQEIIDKINDLEDKEDEELNVAISKLDLKEGDTVLIKTDKPEITLIELAYLKENLIKNLVLKYECLCIVMSNDMEITAVDENEMYKFGWYRSSSALALALEKQKKMTDEDRVQFWFDLQLNYCSNCGRELVSPEDRCHCENDE